MVLVVLDLVAVLAAAIMVHKQLLQLLIPEAAVAVQAVEAVLTELRVQMVVLE
jgi:hypothetical protein